MVCRVDYMLVSATTPKVKFNSLLPPNTTPPLNYSGPSKSVFRSDPTNETGYRIHPNTLKHYLKRIEQKFAGRKLKEQVNLARELREEATAKNAREAFIKSEEEARVKEEAEAKEAEANAMKQCTSGSCSFWL